MLLNNIHSLFRSSARPLYNRTFFLSMSTIVPHQRMLFAKKVGDFKINETPLSLIKNRFQTANSYSQLYF